MSDYLWDKTGEPDAEVERLEGLLEAFGHRPRALELPAEAAPPAAQRSRRFGTAGPVVAPSLPVPPARFRAARLAVAAALLLAFVAGASVLLRTRIATVEQSAATVEHSAANGGSAATVRDSTAAREAHTSSAPSESGTATGVRQGRDEKIAVKVFTPEQKGAQLAVIAKRRQRPAQTAASNGTRGEGEGSAVEALRAESRGGAQAALESTRLMAKEQLVYALRLTGAKLREVQRKTQGLDNSKPAFDARDKLR
jgi:hypothetical protein